MSQTPEAEAFISRIVALPPGPVSLDEALQPSLDDEAALRRLYAQDKTNARLADPHVGLVDVFAAPADIRVTRARVPKDEAELYAKYVVPLSEKRRRAEGAAAIVGDMDAFRKSWAIFTEGSLSQLADWSGVVAAGGSVLACMTPLPEHALESKRAMRKWFHNIAYPSSDVDLFLYGMTPEQAEAKIVEIYEAVRDSVPWDVTCVRTKHAVSIHSQYPYRSVQIVLRLYSSPAEIMAGFDIDACCACYDGNRVWANPRQIVAMMRQCNTVDMTRRSPSYEVRLAKYAMRDFEVYVPTLRREDIDPTIFERAISRIEGLARLLVLEKLADPDARQAYIDARRDLRGRPSIVRRWQDVTRRRYKGDMKADLLEAGLQMNDYDVAVLHIPYGPNWDARRIEKLVYQTDLGMNSPFNPKNKDRRLHRHPAFFGTMDECLADCCEHCPEPKGDEEKKQFEDYNKAYIKGRIQFIQEDPGRQSMSASFNPIDVGDWSELAYVGKTEKFFTAIAASDRATIAQMLQEGTDVNRRDHVGRTALHLAILCGATEIACTLVDAGARMTARVVDGRSSLHLAAQFGRTEVVQKMLERSKANAEKAEYDKTAKAVEPKADEDATMSDAGDEDEDEEMHDSSEDDWSSEGSEGDDKPKKNTTGDTQEMPSVGQGDIPEDAMDEPDIFEINAPDWDLGFTALGHAIVSGSVAIVDALLGAGADATLATKAQRADATELHPLALALFLRDETCADALVRRLVAAGAAASTADGAMMTIFHRAVAADNVALTGALLRGDPKAASVVNLPAMPRSVAVPPTMTAVDKGGYAMLALLLAYGGKITLSEEDVASAIELKNAGSGMNPGMRLFFGGNGATSYPYNVVLPVETAICQRDDILHLILSLGADVNVPVRQAGSSSKDMKLSLLDYTRCAITALRKALDPPPLPEAVVRPADLDGWKAFVMEKAWRANEGLRARWKEQGTNVGASVDMQVTLDWLVEVEAALSAAGAKTWNEIFPDDQLTEQDKPGDRLLSSLARTAYNNSNLQCQSVYGRMSDGWPQQEAVPKHQIVQYDELFAACWHGDHDTIRNLCLPDAALDGRAALQIAVIHNAFVGDNQNLSNTIGYNPLWIAVMAGKWETARLILAIAAAQYKAPDAKPAKYSTKDISLEEDDEGNSDDDSEMSDDTVDQVNFRDLATRPSTVQCNIKPEKLLQATAHWPFTRDGKGQYDPISLLGKTIVEGDLQAFIKVADLYNMLPDTSLDFVLPLIMQHDCPEILDEYIRRTGFGLQLKEDTVKDGHEHGADDNPGKNEYWGLNVHGKKRKDLAKKGDPNARTTLSPREMPLLFWAAENGGLNVMEYLAGERPEKAYRHWAATSSEPRAVRLRRMSEADVKARMPGWLGWEVNDIGESALTTAIFSGKGDSVKKLFALSPKFMKDALNARMKFVGYNSVLLACDTENCVQPPTAGMIDVLLDHGASAEETDHRGWNIFHLLSVGGKVDVLKHVMTKLSDETCLELANKQSKGRWNTPLHLAVKRRQTACVELLLSKDPQGYALARRDVNGSTPLHVAVQMGHTGIVRLLLDACATADPGLLHLENAVGETPLETALQRYLVQCAARPDQNSITPAALNQYRIAPAVVGQGGKLPSRLDARRLEKDVPRLRETLDALGQEGRLIKGSELSNKLEEFWDRTQKALEASLQRKEQLVVPDSEEDRAQTLALVQSALNASQVGRGLVRLDEVQKAVRAKVEEHGEGRGLGDAREKNVKALAKGDGLEEERRTDEEDKKRSVLQPQWVRRGELKIDSPDMY